MERLAKIEDVRHENFQTDIINAVRTELGISNEKLKHVRIIKA